MAKQRLLLIEDNPDTRQIYKDVFERDGFEVLQAEDGEKGLSYAQVTLPDVILLDLMLPKLSGFDLLKCLASRKKQEYSRHDLLGSGGFVRPEESGRIGCHRVFDQGF